MVGKEMGVFRQEGSRGKEGALENGKPQLAIRRFEAEGRGHTKIGGTVAQPDGCVQ